MTALNYLTIVTSLLTIAVGVRIFTRPASMSWRPRTTKIVGASMAILSLVTIILAVTQPHGKA